MSRRHRTLFQSHNGAERPTRDLWLAFGNIGGFNSIDELVHSGAADIVNLNMTDISAVKDARRNSTKLPEKYWAKTWLPFVGAASCIDDVQELAHWVNDRIGRANTALLNASCLISNKETLYRLLEAQGVPIPKIMYARHLRDLLEVLQEIDSPLEEFIVKPAVGTESRGVYRPVPQQSPKDVVESMTALPDIDPREPFIVMPFISNGTAIGEYCLDGIAVGGRLEFCASHEKTHVYKGYPIHDRAMITPSANPIDPRRLETFFAYFCNAFPIKSFVFHLEVRLDRNGDIVPIDLSFRPGGGLIYKSIISSYGIDLRLAHIYCTLGMEDEMLRLARASHSSDRFTAIAAVFANANTTQQLHEKLGRLIGRADEGRGLINYDLSNISILSTASQLVKPNVGLSIFSRRSASDCLEFLQTLVADTAMSLVSPSDEMTARLTKTGTVDGTASSGEMHSAMGTAGDPISRRIAQLVRLIPDAIAIADGDRKFSFSELDILSTTVAHLLRRNGVGLETPVGILIRRSPAFIVAALGILKSGGCYVPLDDTFPKARLAHMIGDATIRHMVTDRADHPLLVDYQDFVLPLTPGALTSDGDGTPVEIQGNIRPKHLACIYYTSGSTGAPKGVAITREAILNLVMDQSYLGLHSPPYVLHSASVAFDAATFEIWAPLLNGGCCVVNSDHTLLPSALAERIISSGVNTAWFNASLFNTIVEDTPEILGKLDRAIVGGEVVSAKHFRYAQQQFPDLVLVNGYGPTEATTFSSCYICPKLPDGADNVPIGHAIRGVELLVLDEKLNEVPEGSEGELHIGGPGLARGYYGKPTLTAESFIPHPYALIPGERLYKTGDRVRKFADGRFEFIGRCDRQIKLRGLRVELDEVERAIRNLPGVRDVVVGSTNGVLGGYLTAKVKVARAGKASALADEIKSALNFTLPAFMIPTHIEIVEVLGTTITGKRASPLHDEKDFGATLASIENLDQRHVLYRLGKIWAEVLDREWPGPSDDFFQLGGHSLSATRVLARIKSQLGVELQLRDIFARTRLEDLAELVEEKLQNINPASGTAVATIGIDAEMSRRAQTLREKILRLSDEQVDSLLRDKRQRRAWHRAEALRERT
ncbi:amino acid adenylation domain-containing protein [Rhizobium leguminosarum]